MDQTTPLDLDNHFHARAYLFAASYVLEEFPAEFSAAHLRDVLLTEGHSDRDKLKLSAIIEMAGSGELADADDDITFLASTCQAFLEDNYFTYMVMQHQTDSKLEPGQPASIPDHDPTRTETVDGFGDGSLTNGGRARDGRAALANPDDIQQDSDIADIVTNLLHYAHSLEMDPFYIRSSGWSNFLAEAGPVPVILDQKTPD